ncbi:DNA repair ATPase [Streptomyces sp. ISL-44]|uniref:DNA repair ATPase n=1 Tax=Streptomyces sp. ISL-44 TaxID=2819184 RepID=UPI001BEA1110|nr:DNA repair ATPase [Streptomyces sp. ISL-44]MBT2546478.1 DNA repair ATPase [Streptomyces sp. ISL-44]
MTSPSPLDAGTYEVLRDRLAAQAGDLARRTEALNTLRTSEFGSTGLVLESTGSMRTEQTCVPRDVVAVGDALLFGYNASPGGAHETAVADVFALHDRDLNPLPGNTVPGLLEDPAFVREFAALHRYYRQARLLRLHHVEGKLLAVFRTGETSEDIRVLRWTLNPADGTASFLDAQGDRDHVLPPAHDFEWTATTREDHVLGRHPHVSIGGDVFVTTVGGNLTVKTEDDTETARGIWSEPVEDPLQSLADAEIEYARVGPLLLLRVRPYKEETRRHLVFDTAARTVVRLDGIGQAARRLPEEQGIVFPGGYHRATGGPRIFGTDTEGLEFERTVRSPNGEDVLYVFHARAQGRSLLLPYNVIRQEAAAPLSCHGYALFDDGDLHVLRAESREPARVHPLQRWGSPYVSDTRAAARPTGSGPLARIGNADLVRGISDLLSITATVRDTTPTTGVYETLVAACARAADRHHWLGEASLGGLKAALYEVRSTAEQVLTEFETVRALTHRAADALAEAEAETTSLVRTARGEAPRTTGEWINLLTGLRRAHGHVLTLKEIRYSDADRIDEVAAAVEADIASFAGRAVSFLADADAFTGYHEDIARICATAADIATVAEAAPLLASLDESAAGLGTVTEVVAGLEIGDATVRTGILERIAEVLGGVNRARATLDASRRELLVHEGQAEFAAESALLAQAVTGALAAADTPQACDDQLARLLLKLENLETRFADSGTFLTELADRRAEVHEAFSSRKQTLQDERASRAERLADSATRILETVTRRAAGLPDADAVSTFFASDPMVAKVCRTADELRELGERARAEELDGRVKAARQEAARALRDRVELYADGGRSVRLGRHHFAVNTQPLDLTLVPQGDGLAFALTGTDYRSPVTDPEFAATRPYWGRTLPSESSEVYRAEYLAVRLFTEHGPDALAGTDLPTLVRRAAEAAYDEGYERGVHDHDAAAILAVLLRLHENAGLLRHTPAARAEAQLFWAHRTTAPERVTWTRRAASLARVRAAFGSTPAIAAFQEELAEAMGAGPRSAAYLFEELAGAPEGFVTSAATRTLLDKFRRSVGTSAYDEDLAALPVLADRRQLVEAWLSAYAATTGEPLGPGDLAEAVAVELCPDLLRYESDAELTGTAEGLLGRHPRVTERTLTIRIDELLARTADFAASGVPGFRAYQRTRATLVAAERTRLRLDEYRPKVMSSFFRGRLLDEVCLPLIGDNLAKQIGTTGETKRTDSNGLLLLVSPPGYGKTTLMEYVADRLGLVLVKANGPALGNAVTSLDPAEAPNATACQEVEKINFALEAGNNTLLYLDDIQHTSPELLQKFIPLCDSTRRMEGVWNGEARTYDLRGKRFAVCMAGNPYTESGERFRIPDMLANRADVWNLGDVLTGKEAAFAASFVENALTSNPVLAPLAGRDRADLDLLLRLADGDPTAHADRLAHPYARAERDRILAVLCHLLTARTTVLSVNAAYIASAAQSDTTRTEPPFRLQGSYRNMNKIAARIDPVMNDSELASLLDDHYTAEAQTLTSGAEANMLKLAELRGTLTPPQAARWAAIKASHVRAEALGGPDSDPLTRAVAALGLLADRVASVESAISRAADPRHAVANPAARHAVRPDEPSPRS